MTRCPQCWRERDEAEFRSRSGERQVSWCLECRDLYQRGGRRTSEQRRARLVARAGHSPRVLCVDSSGNGKLGGIPATFTSAETCPDSCSLRGEGCYAEFNHVANHWRRASTEGVTWAELCNWVSAMPEGQLWRHNVAGDLPGRGDRVNALLLEALCGAASRTRGFTYTHKPVSGACERTSVTWRALERANSSGRTRPDRGLTVNLSADSPVHADELAALGCGPVATIVPPGTRTGDRTPGGQRIVMCPAQTSAALTCAECGLCAVADRRGVVGFRPHGQMARRVARRLPLVSETHTVEVSLLGEGEGRAV